MSVNLLINPCKIEVMYSIKKNISISIIAQIVSMGCGILLQLLIPKFVDVNQYAYWQLFLLYANYVGILHFGLLDGFVLRYSQYDYEQLDKKKLRTQFFVLLLFLSFASFIVCLGGINVSDKNYQQIFLLIAASIIIKITFTYASYSFQITNRIKKYAVQIILQRVAYLIGVLILIFGGVNDFFWFCFVELLGETIAIGYAFSQNPDLFVGKIISFQNIWGELKLNLVAGIMLMVANWTGNFAIALMRLVIQQRWGLLVFGQVSLCFSVMQVFLAFIMAASIALFPSIKRMNPDELPLLYKKLRNSSSVLLLACLIFYFPMAFALNWWLPKYQTSLIYLAMLLPFILYSSKLTMLTNTYLKAYRKEKVMMFINVGTLALGASLFYFMAYIVNSVDAVLYGMLAIMIFRSVISECVVEKIIDQKNISLKIEEFVSSFFFILIAKNLSLVQGFLVYCAVVCLLVAKHRDAIRFLICPLTRHIGRRG